MSNTSLTVSDEEGGSLTLRINDVFDLILKSPMVTQLFARAVTAMVMKVAGGVVDEVVVNIEDTISTIKFETHCMKVSLNARKLKATTDIIAAQIKEAASNLNYPSEMKEELTKRLYELYYAEMAALSPGRT